MTEPRTALRYRFGVFEADSSTGELRRQGVRIRLNAQPFQALLFFLERRGEILTREEISRELWPDGTFVDYEHGVNSAVNRIREALRDTASNPRFIETLARRGYRFVAPVERFSEENSPTSATPIPTQQEPTETPASLGVKVPWQILTTTEDLPKASHRTVQTLFILLQSMYVAFYVGALANLTEIGDLFSVLPFAMQALVAMVVTAAILIPVRAFLVCAVLFHAPGIEQKFRKLWLLLLPLDVLWSLSPFLLLHHINYGLALSCTALLVYSPFAQRSLVLMGAGRAPTKTATGIPV